MSIVKDGDFYIYFPPNPQGAGLIDSKFDSGSAAKYL